MSDQILDAPRLFLEGPAGSGKTTQGVYRLQQLLHDGVRPENILLLVPQRTLTQPYRLALSQPDSPDAAGVDMLTIGGLARRGIELFWSLIARKAEFTNPHQNEPTFLNIETAQYFMTQFVDPMLEEGLFDGISVSRARIITQILDNLNKSANNQIGLDGVYGRLTQAWTGQSSRLNIYQNSYAIAQQFRQHCLDHNLLDYSLQIEVFTKYLLPNKPYQTYLQDKYRHLIADNLEEMPYVAHAFIEQILPDLESALLIYDDEGGYRVFLGADAISAYDLRRVVDDRKNLEVSAVQTTDMIALDETLHIALTTREGEIPKWDGQGEPTAAFEGEFKSFYPQMLDWACEVVVDLIQNQGVEPNEIVMLAPFLNDSLRFTVMNNLREADIPVVSHRPSRAMREEASARAMLTLMQLVNPLEKKYPTPDDILDMLVAIVGGLDPIRAALLTQIVYGVGRDELGSFDTINPAMQERITFSIGERYEYLRQWLNQERERVANTPPDYFLRRLFGDVASQKGFGFHTNLDAGNVIAQLIDSAFNFRQVLYPQGVEDWSPVWMQFRQLVTEGLLAAVHDSSWRKDENQAVFIAPAFTFLLRNRPVKYQIWLDVGSYAWWERLDQPLTHPYVTQRTYPEAQPWTDEDEISAQWEMLRKLVLGLTRRCEEKIYLAIADLGEQGFEQRGPLLRVFQQILQTYSEDE